MKKIFSALFTVLLCSINAFPDSSPEVSSLKTMHFIVRYNTDETPYAAHIAELAESQYSKVESFLNYSLDKQIDIYISWRDSGIALPGFNNALEVCSVSDILVTESELYRKIFMLFLEGISGESSGLLPVKPDNDMPAIMLCSYSIKGFDVNNELIFRDYYLHRAGGRISIADAGDVNIDKGEALYSGFFYFIESVYGKKIMLRALKEMNYYGGFISSLASVTGKTPEIISDEFNSFFAQKFSKYEPAQEKPQFLALPEESYITDFSISPDGNSLVLLTIRSGRQWIEKRELTGGNSYVKQQLDEGVVFKSLCYKGNDSIAMTGNSKGESLVQIYSSDSLIKKKEFRLPGIFLNRITPCSNDELFFLNSRYGVSGGILAADFNEGVLKRKFTDRLLNDSDILYLNKKIYYIAKRDFYELVEADSKTGEEEPVIKLREEISSVSVSGNNIIISSNSSSGGNILLFNPEGRTLKQLDSSALPAYKALIKNNMIYALTYHNGVRRIALKQISR